MIDFLDLPERLRLTPHRISIIISRESAVNGYGFLTKNECRIEIRKSKCLYCKMVENDTFPFCPANGKHRYSDGWVDIASGVADTLDEAISLAIACV